MQAKPEQPCYVCGAEMKPLFQLRVLGKHDVHYFQCETCGYARTEEPYWLEDAYSDAIARADTGILQRNWALSSKLACALFLSFDCRAAYLDVAGGYGLLTRLMRDYGFDFYWQDKFCENLIARGFEAERSSKPFAAVSCFEAVEHTVNPLEFIAQTLEQHHCRNFIFSTVTYDRPRPDPNWWYLSPATGQHISFFQQRTLRIMAERLQLHFYSNAGLHIFSERRLRNAWMLRCLHTAVAIPLAQLVRRRIGSRMIQDNERLLLDQAGERQPAP
jgi:hypothetical protein